MRMILNGINGRYLREISENAAKDTDLVEAAVAYATNEALLFDWCWENKVPLRFWGRFDDSVPVNLNILKTFLRRESPNFTCKLLTHFHAKVIWWHGVGAYVGSANLTDSAWYNNIEAGCFFDEAELIASAMDIELREFFQQVDKNASPLTDELYRAIESRAKELQQIYERDRDQQKKILSIPSIRQWNGLVQEARNTARDRQKNAFLDEWHETLQILRDIGKTVSRNENRPVWVSSDVPIGAQADQFLHAYYYNTGFDDGRRSMYAENFEKNKDNPAAALKNAIDWWRRQPSPPSKEDRMLFEWAPFLRDKLSSEHVLSLSETDFEEVCRRVWSIQDHARRMANTTLNLVNGKSHDMATKTGELSRFLFSRRAPNGMNVLEIIHHVLYGGGDDCLPVRLWEATSDDRWRIDHLGISSLGELVGWALPDKFPPRNNRTSKALRSLGYPVTVHG